MKDYKAKRTIGNREKHVVYYLHTEQNVPVSLGWDSKEIAQFVKEDRHLSIYVGFPAERANKRNNH